MNLTFLNAWTIRCIHPLVRFSSIQSDKFTSEDTRSMARAVLVAVVVNVFPDEVKSVC
jgi:hypothetical protein